MTLVRKLFRPALSVDAVALLASIYFALVSNRLFWHAILRDRDLSAATSWTFAAAIMIALVALHLSLLALVLNRWTLKAMLCALLLATAAATYFMQSFGIYLDPSMVRNALHSEPKEAVELIGSGLLSHVLIEAGPFLVLIALIRVRHRPLRAALVRRIGTLSLSLILLVGAVFFAYQDLSSLFRNQKEIRYLITPANALYSLARVALADQRESLTALAPVAPDAALGASWAHHDKPVLLVIVVGETARAANWGLNGYGRDTTPELGALLRSTPNNLVNFSRVGSCGTDTETSVPCLFSAIGRRHYDERRIRGSESLLHVLARAGFRVTWRDNQTGCKGVCSGLAFEQIDKARAECAPGRCFDELLLDGLDDIVDAPRQMEGDARRARGEVIVLHQLGNHGPAYFHRYPDTFKTFAPTCDTAELRDCTVEAIRNGYDNALRYTDHVLAAAIAYLQAREATHDTALIYLSDHGESLGENGLFLHGFPYAIAPAVQTQVPMVLWTSPSYRKAFGLDVGCLRAKSDAPLTHDYFFHTVLGLLQVDTKDLEPALDLAGACRIDRLAHAG